MDGFIRKVSIAAARMTTRRDFLSRLVRGLVGVGLGAGYLFGRGRTAFADRKCTESNIRAFIDPDANPVSECSSRKCQEGSDARGCNPPSADKPRCKEATCMMAGFKDGRPECTVVKRTIRDETTKMDKDVAYPVMTAFWVCCCPKKPEAFDPRDPAKKNPALGEFHLSWCFHCRPALNVAAFCICQKWTDPCNPRLEQLFPPKDDTKQK